MVITHKILALLLIASSAMSVSACSLGEKVGSEADKHAEKFMEENPESIRTVTPTIPDAVATEIPDKYSPMVQAAQEFIDTTDSPSKQLVAEFLFHKYETDITLQAIEYVLTHVHASWSDSDQVKDVVDRARNKLPEWKR